MLCGRLPQRLRWGSGGGFKGTGCRAPRERHCKRKNVPRRRKPLGRKSVIADIMSVRRQVTNEERTLRGASQKTYIAEDRQQRALSPWCMDRQECAPTFPVWENAGIFSAYGYVRSRRFFQPSAFHKGGRGESLSRLLSFLWLRGVGGMIGNSGTAAHAAVPELPGRITPRRWKIPASRRNTFTRRRNCGMIHLYPTIMPWGEAALTAPGLVGQAPPRLRFAGAGLDADMAPCGTGRKTAPEI